MAKKQLAQPGHDLVIEPFSNEQQLRCSCGLIIRLGVNPSVDDVDAQIESHLASNKRDAAE